MRRLQSSRLWLGGGGLVAVLIIALVWFLFVGPQLSSAGELHDQAAATRQSNEQLGLKVRTLEAKSTKLPQYTSSLKAALAALPYDSGLPAFTRQLNRQALANGVSVSSVVVGGVSPVEAASAPAASSDGATAGTPATPAQGAGAVAAFSIQVTVQSNGPLRRQLAFIKDLQAGPRRALVSAAQVSPGSASKGNSVDGQASLSTQLSIFSVPQTPEQIRQLKKLLAGNLSD